MTTIGLKFNLKNRPTLWKLRAYHGSDLLETECDQLGRIIRLSGTQSDLIIAAGRNVYVDVPVDESNPYEVELEREAREVAAC